MSIFIWLVLASITMLPFLQECKPMIDRSQLEVITPGNVEFLQELATIEVDTRQVTSMFFKSKHELIYTSRGGLVTILDLENGQSEIIRHCEGYFDVAVSPTFSVLVCTGTRTDGWIDGTIDIVDYESGEIIRSLDGSNDGPGIRAFSPNGEYLAASTGVNRETYVFDLWNIATGELAFTTRDFGNTMFVSFSSDGEFAAVHGGTRGSQNNVYLIDVTTFELVHHIEQWSWLDESKTNPAMGLLTLGAGFSNDDEQITLLSGEGRLTIFSVASGEELLSMQDQSRLRTEAERYFEPIDGLDYSPDDLLLVTTDGQVLRLWDVVAQDVIWAVERATSIVVFSPDGKLLVTRDGEYWDGQSQSYQGNNHIIRFWGIPGRN